MSAELINIEFPISNNLYKLTILVRDSILCLIGDWGRMIRSPHSIDPDFLSHVFDVCIFFI
jgi:hypothetical protein